MAQNGQNRIRMFRRILGQTGEQASPESHLLQWYRLISAEGRSIRVGPERMRF